MKIKGLRNLNTFKLSSREWNRHGVNLNPLQPELKTAADIIEGYEKTIDEIKHAFEDEFVIEPQIINHLNTECKYRVYIEK